MNAKHDEIGDLATSFDQMQRNIVEIVQEIKSSSNEVAMNAECVSNFNQELSQGIEEQASALEQISATVEQATKQIAQSTQNIEEAFNEANKVTVDAEKGQKEMIEMLSAMGEISESSTKISKIIRVIDDIAFQTNILALNAAVEAARAGQHGKGFAVVAEEVRNLAARSANAAKETTEMIESVHGKIDGGEKIAKQTSEALEQMVQGIHSISRTIAQISSASQDEAVAMQQINLAIAQVADVVQGNTAISEEVAAISQEMFSQSELLKENTAKFRLGAVYKKQTMIQLEEARAKHSGTYLNTVNKKSKPSDKNVSLGQRNTKGRSTAKKEMYESLAAGDEDEVIIKLDDDEFDRY
jgi:methyl-accepting chemotaxis protein